ncbi:MAG: hypothetical protein ACR2OJ_06390 [Hyphomicrobiales bacterium]
MAAHALRIEKQDAIRSVKDVAASTSSQVPFATSLYLLNAFIRAQPIGEDIVFPDEGFDFALFCHRHKLMQALADGVSYEAEQHASLDLIAPVFRHVAEETRAHNDAVFQELRELLFSLRRITLPPVLLNGTALMVMQNGRADNWFRADNIELLIGTHELEASIYALAHLGYEPRSTDYDFRRDAQYPVLRKPDGAAGISFYTQPIEMDLKALLAADEVRARALGVQVDGREVFSASPEDRLISLVSRSMILEKGYQSHSVLLCGALEYLDIVSRHDVPIDLICEHFSAAGYAEHFEAFVCCLGLIWGDLVSYPDWCRVGEAWAEKVFEKLETKSFWQGSIEGDWKRILHNELSGQTGLVHLFNGIRRAGGRSSFAQVPQLTRLAS